MADSIAKDGKPKAAPAKAASSKPRKVAKPASPVLPAKASAKAPVKSVARKAAKPAAPVAKVPAPKAAKPLAAPVEAVAKVVEPIAEPVALPPAAAEVVETPAAPAIPVIEIPAAPVEAAQETVTAIQQNVTEGMKQMATKTETVVDQAQALFGDFNERAKGVMEKNAKIVQEVSDLTKGNVEAMVASSRAAAKGIEALSREAAEYSRKSFEDVSGALKNFAEVRSPADFFRLQSDYARSAFDALVAESSKMSEVVVKLAGEVAEPITNRYSVAAERVRSIAL